MGALTVDQNYKTRDRGRQLYLLKNGVTVYKGSLIGVLKSTGYADKWTDASLLQFKGIAVQGAVGDTGATPIPTVSVDETGMILEQVTVTGVSAITDLDAPIYATYDGTFTLTPTTYGKPVARFVKWYASTTCDIKLLTPEEYRLALVAADITALTDNSGGAAADSTIGAISVTGALTDNSGGTAADGTIAATAATAGACAGGATPTATQVDTAIATAVASIVTGVNDAVKELATKATADRASLTALTDAVAELAAKQNAVLTAINAIQ